MRASEQQRGGLPGCLRACRAAAWLEYRNLRFYPSNLLLAAVQELTAVGVWYFVGRFLNAGASQAVQQDGGNYLAYVVIAHYCTRNRTHGSDFSLLSLRMSRTSFAVAFIRVSANRQGRLLVVARLRLLVKPLFLPAVYWCDRVALSTRFIVPGAETRQMGIRVWGSGSCSGACATVAQLLAGSPTRSTPHR